MTIALAERLVITQALKFYHGDKKTTAKALDCAVNTLNNKLELYAKEDAKKKAEDDERIAQEADFDRRQRGQSNGASKAPLVTPIREDVHSSDPRLCMEPPSHTPSEHPVPVSQSEDVQDVLPRHAAPGGTGKRR